MLISSSGTPPFYRLLVVFSWVAHNLWTRNDLKELFSGQHVCPLQYWKEAWEKGIVNSFVTILLLSDNIFNQISKRTFHEKKTTIFYCLNPPDPGGQKHLIKKNSVGFANKTPGYSRDSFRPPTVKKNISEKQPFCMPSKAFFLQFLF